MLEPQGVGLPLLLAGPYKAGGTTLARLLLAALAATAFGAAARSARRLCPDPWAALAALAFGLSPPVVAAATTVRPEIPAAAALAGAAVLALRIRDDPARPGHVLGRGAPRRGAVDRAARGRAPRSSSPSR